MALAEVFSFPNPVNEKAARLVAGGVAVLAIVALLTRSPWVVALLLLGFAARAAAGPRFSLLGRLSTQVLAPRLGMPKFVPGPPKRFAQLIGLVLTAVTTILAFSLGFNLAAVALVAVLLVFALMESVLGLCAGCWMFAGLMRIGVIPPETCAECNDIWSRYGS